MHACSDWSLEMESVYSSEPRLEVITYNKRIFSVDQQITGAYPAISTAATIGNIHALLEALRAPSNCFQRQIRHIKQDLYASKHTSNLLIFEYFLSCNWREIQAMYYIASELNVSQVVNPSCEQKWAPRTFFEPFIICSSDKTFPPVLWKLVDQFYIMFQRK